MVTDAELQSAKARWAEERAGRPIPVSVRFDRETERIVVDFANGAKGGRPRKTIG